MSGACAAGGAGREADSAEGALLRRLRAGEDAAFAELVERHGGRMLAVARRIARTEEDAADAVQDAFVSAFRALPAFEGESSLGTWLHRITVNAALMRVRAARRREAREIESLLPRYVEDGHREGVRAAWAETPEELLARREAAAVVRARIDALPEDFRLALILRDVEGLDTEETAAALGITPGAVKTRLHRARQALRTMLEREFAS